MSRAHDGRPPRPTNGRQLWRATLAELRRGWKIYALTVLVVTVPLRLLDATTTLGSNPSFMAYSTVISLIMNLALLAVCRWRLAGEAVSLRRAYFDGTAPVVRFAIVNLLVALCLIPAALGAYIMNLGTSAGSSAGEAIVVLLFGLAFVAVSLWPFTRFVLGIIHSVATPDGPIASVAAARRLTLGRFWVVLGRLVVLGLGALAIVAVCFGIVTLIGLGVHNATLLASLFQFLVGLIVLPIASIYLTRLHASLVDISS